MCLGRFGYAKVSEICVYVEQKTTPKLLWIDFRWERTIASLMGKTHISTDHVFGYSEVFTGDNNTLLSYVKKNIDPSDPGRYGGNPDSLDFSAFFALRDNLSGMGTANA